MEWLKGSVVARVHDVELILFLQMRMRDDGLPPCKGPGQSGMVEAGGGTEAQSFDNLNVVIGSFRKKRKGGGLKNPLAFGLGLRHLRKRATGRPRSKQRTELKLVGRGLASSSEDKVKKGLNPAVGAAERFRLGQCNSTPISGCDASGGCASLASIEETGSTEMNRDRAPTEHYEAEGRRSKSPPLANKVARLQSTDELEHDCLGVEQIWEVGKALGLEFFGDENVVKKRIS
ncbi:hypothetical protein Ancab_025016 [Ancistrocladus abbreviatus]